jgi:hypothetical protein
VQRQTGERIVNFQSSVVFDKTVFLNLLINRLILGRVGSWAQFV